MFSAVRHNNKGKVGWEKRKITWVFWKSHVTELCEKWIGSKGNYAYTRFEEFRTCTGEVLFTNEHKAVISRKETDCYTPIKDLDIFKDFLAIVKQYLRLNRLLPKLLK